MKTLLCLVLSGCGAWGACLPLKSDRILGRDLAVALPAFSAMSGGTIVGYAPSPGTQRVFSVAELSRIARANHVAVDAPFPVCFEIPTHVVETGDLLDSMRRVLPAGVDVSVNEAPRSPVPAGRLDFPLSGLEPAAGGSRMWRGTVRYGETLRMPVWARVTVEWKALGVVAARDLAAGAVIEAAGLRLEKIALPFDSRRPVLRVEDAVGRAPVKAVRAGEPVLEAVLTLPPSVHRGDPVKVEVRSGKAHLVFDAIALAAAGDGDMVELKNPESGKVFRARVEKSGRAILILPSRQAL